MKTKVLDHFHNQFTAKKGKSSELLVRTRPGSEKKLGPADG